MAKIALLIGVSEYKLGLNPLPAAVRDVEAMQEVLQHPNMGAFDQVVLLRNPGLLEMRREIERLFADRTQDDLVLLYFSGHGVTDEYGKFFFTNRESEKTQQGSLVKSTVDQASFVHGLMENCNSERQVIILDCCHSGAFPEGMTARDAGSVIDFKQQLGGKGRVVLTSSAATEYSFERDGEELAIYTRYLVEGIKTGAADLDNDGAVSVNELHDYVKAKVQKSAPAMKPERYVFKDGEKILLAKALLSDPKRRYRKEVQKRIRNGKLVAKRSLIEIAQDLNLSIDDATTIENTELEPYRELQRKLDKYREAFLEEIADGYPFSEETRFELQDFQQVLGLRDEDIRSIEAEILKERNKQPQAPAITAQPSSTVSRPSFSFEIITVNAKGQEIDRRLGQAEFFAENLDNNGVTLEMVAIPGGTFQMGSSKSEKERSNSESPQHTVTISPFFLGKYLITQAQWKAIAALPKINIDLNPNPSHFKGENRPIEQVSWDDAIEFCARLSKKTGQNYRLLSEAEWEYACRAGTTTPFYFGETITTDLVNYNGNYTYGSGKKGEYREQTTDVGTFPPNAFGLCDMHGNVWEWCADSWHENYDRAPSDGSVWELESDRDNSLRLVRGGSWGNYPRDCRSAVRDGIQRDYRNYYLGFRVAVSLARTL